MRGARLFGVLLLLLTLAKVLATLDVSELGIDGAYYTDVAQHVRDGLGLQTRQSLYHKGYPSFPHPTSVYPLWPLLLGLLGRLVDLQWLAHWLPAALYVGSLGAAWGLGRALRPDSFFQRVHLDGGHLLMLLLGLNTEYFTYTSLPYTEGLSWLLLLLFGARLLRVAPREDLLSGAELGVWAAALVLCRAQFLIVPIALVAALLLRLRGLRDLARLGAFAAVFCTGVAPHMLRSASFLQSEGLLNLLRFDQAQVSAALEPLPVLIQTPGLGSMLADRAGGLSLAFDPFGDGYAVHFFAFAYALPALPLLLLAHRRTLPSLLSRALSPQATPYWVLGLFALGGLASIHLAHKSYEPAWYFHRRHALVVLPAIFAGLWGLLALRGPAKLPGLLLLLAGVGQGSWELATRAAAGTVEPWAARPKRLELHRWLEVQSAEEELVVAITSPDAQRLAWRTPRVGFHSLHERSSPRVVETLCRDFQVDLLLFPVKAGGQWDFREDFQAPAGYEALEERPGGFLIYRRTEK